LAEDAADALAIALCHCSARPFRVIAIGPISQADPPGDGDPDMIASIKMAR